MPNPNNQQLIDWGKPESWPTGWQKQIPRKISSVIPIGSLPAANAQGLTSIFTSQPQGFGTFAAQQQQWQMESLRWQYATGLNAMKTSTQAQPTLGWFPSFVKFAISSLTGGEQPKPKTIYEEPVTEPALIVAQTKRVNFMAGFYSTIENLVNLGEVKSLDDYAKVSQMNPQDCNLTADDYASIDAAITQLTSTTGQTTPTPEQQLTEFLTAQPQVVKLAPIPIHRVTVDEIIKNLSTGLAETTTANEGAVQDILSSAKDMGIPDDYQKEIADYKASLAPYFDALRSQNANIEAAMKGVAEWKMPDVSFWTQVKFAFSQPMQEVADLYQNTIGKNLADPLAGLLVYSANKLFHGTPQVDTLFDQYKSQGIDSWHALGTMYQTDTLFDNGTLNTIGKMTVSAITDPLTYLPGWGLSIPAKGLKTLGFKTFSEELLSANRWLWQVTNIPFDAFKGLLAKLPLPAEQVIKREADNVGNLLFANASKEVDDITKLTAQKAVETITSSVEAFEKAPGDLGSSVSLGRFFKTPTTIEPTGIVSLASKLGVDAKSFELEGAQVVSDSMIERVNDIVKGVAQKTIPIEQATVDLLKEFGVPKNLANLNKASQILLDLSKSASQSRIDMLQQLAGKEGATFGDVLKAARTQQVVLSRDYLNSMYALTKQRQGIMQSFVNGVDSLQKAKWRRSMDRLYNTPFALSYIANIGTTVGNVIGEPQLAQLLEGIRPGFGKAEEYLAWTKGLTGDFALTNEAIGATGGSFSLAKDVVGRSYVTSILPKGKWLDYLGNNMLKAQNTAGAMTRWQAVNQLMKKNFADVLRKANILPGVDIPKAIADATKNVPDLPKGFGLKSSQIAEATQASHIADLFNPDTVTQALKERFSPTNILKGEVGKIVRGYESLSNDAKSAVLDTVEHTDVLASLDSIKALSTKAEDMSLNSLRQSVWNRSVQFSDLADRFSTLPIDTPEQYASMLYTYSNLVDTAKNTIQDLIKSTADDADKAFMVKKLGKAGKIWREGITNIVDEKDSIWRSIRQIQTKLQNSTDTLTTSQAVAADKFMSDLDAQISNASTYLEDHYAAVEAVWKRIRTEHPEGTELDAIWGRYRQDQLARRASFANADAVLGSSSIMSRLDSARAILSLPERGVPVSIDVSARTVSPIDIAQLAGCDMEDVYRNLVETMVMQDKPHFVQLMKKIADSKPGQYIGFTEQKLGEVYDHIVQNIGMKRGESGAEFEIRKSANDLKMQLVDLKAKKSMVFDAQPKLAAYFDGVGSKMKELVGAGKVAKVVPQVTLATNPEVAGLTEVSASVGGKSAGSITYSEGKDYLLIETTKVAEEFQQQGVGERLLRDMIARSERFNKPLLSGPVVQEGQPFLDALEKRGVITLSEPSEALSNLGKYVISRGPNFETPITKAALAPTAQGISKQSWNSLRQQAMDESLKTYYQMFADYENASIFGTLGRMLFPFWKYEAYRWNWLARTAVRHPGAVDAWARYYESTDQGKTGVGGDLAINTLAGTVLGPLFGLARRDYPSYYENLGPLTGLMDAAQRFAFFPNPAVMTIAYLSPVLTGNKPELGALLPGLYTFGLNALIASKIPGVSKAAETLQDTILHSNFRDYYKALVVNEKQLSAGGTLAGGITGPELWEKLKTGEKLTPDEQGLWDSTEQDVALISMLRSEFAYLSYSPSEIQSIQDSVDKIYESYGFTSTQMKYMREHNIRPSDIMGGTPLAIRQQLDDMWQWKFVGGTSELLAPPSVQDWKIRVNQYYEAVGAISDNRIAEEADLENRFLNPLSTTKPLTPSDFKAVYASLWDEYNSKMDYLNKQDSRYNGTEFQTVVSNTVEGKALLAQKTGGYAAYMPSPMDTLISFWYDVKVEDRVNPHTGEEEPDYLMYTLKRQAVLDAVPPELQQQFLDWVHKNSTPLELRRDQIMNQYIRGYLNITNIVYSTYDEESKSLIDEYYSGGVTRERKAEILQELDPKTGLQLISSYSSALTRAREKLRDMSPTLDFWLYVFGYVTQPRTSQAKAMVDAWDRNRSSILSQ